MKYRANGVERKLSFGKYPEVTLADARKARDSARAMASAGCDPATAKRRDRVTRKLPRRRHSGTSRWKPAANDLLSASFTQPSESFATSRPAGPRPSRQRAIRLRRCGLRQALRPQYADPRRRFPERPRQPLLRGERHTAVARAHDRGTEYCGNTEPCGRYAQGVRQATQTAFLCRGPHLLQSTPQKITKTRFLFKHRWNDRQPRSP